MKKITFSMGLLAAAIPLVFAILPAWPGTVFTPNNAKTNEGIQFEKNGWDQALSEAKKQNKLVFLDAYASWCGPCKLLKTATFTDKTVGDFFNGNFINVTVDMEKGIGIELAKRYQVAAYPTLIIADSYGNVITYTKGYLTPDQLIQFGKYGLSRAAGK